MKSAKFITLIALVLASCQDTQEPAPTPTCESEEPPAVTCSETSDTRTINLDCLQPENDSIYWAIVEVKINSYDYEEIEFESGDQLSEHILLNGQIIYERNIPCTESCDPSDCINSFYDSASTEMTNVEGGYLSFFDYEDAGKRIDNTECSPPPGPNTYRFCITSSPSETKILNSEEFKEFLGSVDSYSEALLLFYFNIGDDPLNYSFPDLVSLDTSSTSFDFTYNYTNVKYSTNGDTCRIQDLLRSQTLDKTTQIIGEPQDSLINEILGYPVCCPCYPCEPFD